MQTPWSIVPVSTLLMLFQQDCFCSSPHANGRSEKQPAKILKFELVHFRHHTSPSPSDHANPLLLHSIIVLRHPDVPISSHWLARNLASLAAPPSSPRGPSPLRQLPHCSHRSVHTDRRRPCTMQRTAILLGLLAAVALVATTVAAATAPRTPDHEVRGSVDRCDRSLRACHARQGECS